MDPTTVAPPSPPQNPDIPKKALPITTTNMAKFRSLLFKVAGPLSPAHRSHIQQRFTDILPTELLVPDHPPYADMILNALWELKAKGGSSVEAISGYIEKEYHNLPWAHATILKHHLRDLCMKGKITLMNNSCYILCSLGTDPEPSGSSSSPSSSDSSSSASFCTSPTSSSSSPSPSSSSSGLSASGRYRARKRKNIKRRKGKKVPVRGGDRGRVRGRSPVTIRVRQRGRGRFDVEGSIKVEELEQGTEDLNEVTVMEDEDYPVKDGDVPIVVAEISEEKNMACEQNKVEEPKQEAEDQDENYSIKDGGVPDVIAKIIEQNLPCEENKVEKPKQEREDQNEVTVIDDKEYSNKDGDVPDVIAKISEKDNLPWEENNKEEHQPQKMYNVTWIGRRVRKIEEAKSESLDVQSDDVSDATFEEHVEQSEHIEENQQPDIVEVRAFEDEQLVDDEKTEPTEQSDHLTREQVDKNEQPADLHHDHDVAADDVDHDDADNNDGAGVTEEPIHPQEECDEKTEESHESCKQNQMKNAEAESAQHVEQLEQIQENQQCDAVDIRAFENEQLRDDEKTKPNKQLDDITTEQTEAKEQSADPHHDDAGDDHDAAAAADHDADDDVHDGVTEEPIHPQEECDEKTEESHESGKQDQMKNAEAESAEHVEQLKQGEEKEQTDTASQRAFEDDQLMDDEKTEPNVQLDQRAETKEQSADLHHDDNDDDVADDDDVHDGDVVTEEPIHPQEECDEKTEESHESCKQDQLKNAEAESAEHEQQQTEVNLEECFLDEVQPESSEIYEKDSLQENNNLASKENMTSSGSTVKESRPPPRQGLRSSIKKEDVTPNPKTQLELVTPVRRSLRSNKANSEAATITTEVPDHSKEQLTHSGRTRSSKRKIPEAGQVSNTRKTRRNGI